MILTSVDALKIFLCSVQSFHKHLLGKRHARTVLEKQGKELDAEEFKSFCQVMKFKDGGHWMWLFVPWKQSLLVFFTHEFQINISLYTDVVLFIFLFFWKTSASGKRGEHVSETCKNERGARERKISSSSSTSAPLCWWSINPPWFIFYHARPTDFE